MSSPNENVLVRVALRSLRGLLCCAVGIARRLRRWEEETDSVQVLATQDEECMQVIAEVLENPSVDINQHIYWNNFESEDTWDLWNFVQTLLLPKAELSCTMM